MDKIKEVSFGKALPQSQWIQKYERTDPHKHIPFAVEDDALKMTKKQWILYGIVLVCCFSGGFVL